MKPELQFLTSEGFDALQTVIFKSITVDQLRMTFHGARYDVRYGKATAAHLHEFFEFHYILDGCVNVQIGNWEQTVTPGHFYLMKPQTIHCHSCQPAPNNYCLSFALRWSWERLGGDLINPELDNIQYTLDNASPRGMADPDWKIAGKLNSIIEAAQSGTSRCELEMMLVGLVFHIGNRYLAPKEGIRPIPTMPKAAETILNQSIKFIEQHSTEMITPSEVAASIPISYSHLARLFSKYMSISVSTYIMQVKIDKAVHLLLTTDMEINDVSVMTGFNSLSYFSYSFKNMMGVSPRDFRQYWRNRYFIGDSTVL